MHDESQAGLNSAKTFITEIIFFVVKRLVFHLDRNLLLHLLHLQSRIFVVLLQFLNEAVQSVVNGLLVPLMDGCLHFQTGLESCSLTRPECAGVVVTASTMMPAAPLQASCVVTVEF